MKVSGLIPALTTLPSLSCPRYPPLTILPSLSCPHYLALAILPSLSSPRYPALATLPSLSCPQPLVSLHQNVAYTCTLCSKGVLVTSLHSFYYCKAGKVFVVEKNSDNIVVTHHVVSTPRLSSNRVCASSGIERHLYSQSDTLVCIPLQVYLLFIEDFFLQCCALSQQMEHFS